jgi:hypothetical protein
MEESYQIPTDGPLVAFKEWQSICDALANGRQSLILRKGGIAEGRDGFAFKHKAFFLFPTLFHHQWDSIKEVPNNPPKLPESDDRETVTIDLYAKVVSAEVLEDWQSVGVLHEHHVWKEEVIRERFDYNDHGSIHLAVLRVYRLARPWVLPYQRNFGGCRSWLNLPIDRYTKTEGIPVMSDRKFAILLRKLKAH